MKGTDDVPRQLDFRGVAIALSVRDKALLDAASEVLFPGVDVPDGVVIGELASEVADVDAAENHVY